MNIAQIEEAVHRGVPFKLKVSDGDEYQVPHADYIFLPPKSSAKRTYVCVGLAAADDYQFDLSD
jgi:hypothetical protein